MKQDDVLAQVRAHVRRERTDDAALEAVARGETGTPLVADLEQRAATDAQALATLEACRPLGDAVEARIAMRLGANATSNAHEKAKAPRVVPFVRRASVVAGPLAIAAAVLLYFVAGPSQSDGFLPDYSVAASSDRDMRGAPESPQSRITVRRGGTDGSFELIARPATRAGAKVVAYAFAIGEGEPNPVDVKVELADEGSVRIRGRTQALQGAREMRIVVGTPTPDSIGRFDDAVARARSGKSDAHVRVLTVQITRE